MNERLPLSTVACANCGDDIADAGYLPAAYEDGEHDPLPEGALCTTCGFSEVGFAGCAPELGDVERVDADVLLHVERVDDGYEVLGAKK